MFIFVPAVILPIFHLSIVSVYFSVQACHSFPDILPGILTSSDDEEGSASVMPMPVFSELSSDLNIANQTVAAPVLSTKTPNNPVIPTTLPSSTETTVTETDSNTLIQNLMNITSGLSMKTQLKLSIQLPPKNKSNIAFKNSLKHEKSLNFISKAPKVTSLDSSNMISKTKNSKQQQHKLPECYKKILRYRWNIARNPVFDSVKSLIHSAHQSHDCTGRFT